MPNQSSRDHIEMMIVAANHLQELINKSVSKEQIPQLKDILLPWGIPMGANFREVITHLGNFQITGQYNLPVSMGYFYKVYFATIQIHRMNLIAQFHLLNNQLYLSRTDFLSQLNSDQYERFLNGFIGENQHPGHHTGIIVPYYMTDPQSNLLRIHNPIGYLSVMYYSGNKRLQTTIGSIFAKKNLAKLIAEKG